MGSGSAAQVWINGTLYAPENAQVSVIDHRILVGDGVFETVKAVNGQPFALTRHLWRLAASAAGLGLPELDLDVIRQGILDVLASAPAWDLARIRITVTSGVRPVSSERDTDGPTAIIAVSEQQPFPDRARSANRCPNTICCRRRPTSRASAAAFPSFVWQTAMDGTAAR